MLKKLLLMGVVSRCLVPFKKMSGLTVSKIIKSIISTLTEYLPCTIHISKCFIQLNSLNYPKNPTIIPHFTDQETEAPCQGQTASEWWSRDLNPDCLASESLIATLPCSKRWSFTNGFKEQRGMQRIYRRFISN